MKRKDTSMIPVRPPRSYRTARERVASKRRVASLAPARPRLHRRGSGCNTIFVGVAAALVLAGVAMVLFTGFVSSSLGKIVRPDARQHQPGTDETGPGTLVEAAEATPGATLDPFNVLLLGVDSREDPDDGARSDTLIVVHVNPGEKWASMLSIPRDSVTQIRGLGLSKINAAYTFGYKNADYLYEENTDPADAGAALAAETVEQFLGIRIDYTAQVDFFGFERVVDTIGGITMDIPRPLLDPEYPTEDYGFERIYIPAGLQVLDGHTALRYARSRHSASDFDRSCRQQRVLRALLREVRQRNLLDQVSLVPKLIEDMEQSVATTMPINDLSTLRALADLARSLSSDRILQFSINPNNVQIVQEGDGVSASNIYWNESDIKLLVARMLAGPTTSEKVPMVQVLNGAGVQGLATRVTNNLATRGFTMVEADDAPYLYEHSLVIDYTGSPETRQRLAQVLGIEADYVQAEPGEEAPLAPYNTDIVLVLGQDYQEEWAAVSESAPTPPPPAPAAPSEEEVPNMPPGCSADF